MEENFSFGYWLRRQRVARDLRQADFAQQLGIAPITLRKIEADERRPSLQLITRVADFLALSAAERARLLQVARADLSPSALPLPERAHDVGVAEAPADTATEEVATPLPTGTVTILFTDIEGSTARWEQQPTAMRPALAQHDALLRAAIGEHGGVVVKGTGDGLLAVFAVAEDALTSALAAQRALQQADWGALGNLPVRMALHTGTAEPQAGDYVGPTLNRAARILATGHGGQILLSRATAELLHDQIPSTITLQPLGSFRLKDLTRHEQIVQVVVADLPANFPTLRTLDARQHNLPAHATALIGRERDVAHLCGVLGRADVRLVTLTGPGGTGKTRLALQAAAELIEQFTHGVWFVNLAPVTDPTRILATIAQTLNVRELSGRTLAETLRDALREQQILLVLDNFEQIIAAAPGIASLLASAPQLKILVTSREALHLAAEQIVAVPPLALPERMAQLPITQISQYEAVRLFIERARAVRAEFTLTHTNASAVTEICWRLDGLPLAIELAAARIRLFTPEALLARLEQRLQLLTGGPRDLPARQQTLRTTIHWSYALLTETEQRLFRQLGVFVGGWSLAGALAVGQHDEIATLDLLTALLDKSLIKQIEGPDGEPRFTMLETIREYALEQQEHISERADLQARHAEYILTMMEEVAPQLRGPNRDIWCDLLTLEQDNLRVVLGRFVAQGDAELLARMCIATWRFWWVRGHWREGREWLEQALELLPKHVTSEAETRLRANTLVGLVWMTIGVSNFAVALPLAEESLALFVGTTDILGTGDAWLGIAHATYGLSDLLRTTSAIVQAHAHYRAGGDLSNTVYTQHLIGYIQYIQGEFAAAQASQQEALSIAQAIGDQRGMAMALGQLGMLAAARCEYDVAEELITEALRLNRALQHRFEISGDLICLGLVAEMQGDYARAEALQREGIEQRHSIGDRRGMASAMANLVRVLLQQGDLEQSQACCRDLLAVVQELNYFAGYCWYLTLMGYQSIAIQQYDRAARLLGSAEALRDTYAIPIEVDERKLYDQAITTLRDVLDDQGFARAWAEGRQFSLNQALAYAQER